MARSPLRSSEVPEPRSVAPWLQLVVLAVLPLLITAHPFLYYSSSDRRGYSRNIRPLACGTKQGDTGVCMFAWDCMKANGTHLGTCIDRFYFGSCCKLKPGTPKPVHTPMKTNFTIRATTTAPELQTMPTDPDSANEIGDTLQPVEPSPSQPMDNDLIQLIVGEATIEPDSDSLVPEVDEISTLIPATGNQDETFTVVETPVEQGIDQTLESAGLPMQEIEQQMQNDLVLQSQSTQADGQQEDEEIDLISDSQQIDQQIDGAIIQDLDQIIPAVSEIVDGQQNHLTQEDDNDQDILSLSGVTEQSNSSQSSAVEINHIDEFVNEMIQSENVEGGDAIDSVSVMGEGQSLPSGDTEVTDVINSTDSVQQESSFNDGTDQDIYDEKIPSSSMQLAKPATEEQTTAQSNIVQQPDGSTQDEEGNIDEEIDSETSTTAEIFGVTGEGSQTTTELPQDLEGEGQNGDDDQEDKTIQLADSIDNGQSDNADEKNTSVDEQTEVYENEDSFIITQDAESTTSESQISTSGGDSDGADTDEKGTANQILESLEPLEDPNVDDQTLDVMIDQIYTTDGFDSTNVSATDDNESTVTESQTLDETTQIGELESYSPDTQEQVDSSITQSEDNGEDNAGDGLLEDSVQSATAQSAIEGIVEDTTVPEQETEELASDNEEDQQQIDGGSEPDILETTEKVTIKEQTDSEQTQTIDQGEQVDLVDQEDPIENEQSETQSESDSTDQENSSDTTHASVSQTVENDTFLVETSSSGGVISETESAQSDASAVEDETDHAEGNVTEEPGNQVNDFESEVTQIEYQPSTVKSSSQVSDATEFTTQTITTSGGSEEQGQTTTSPIAEDSFIVPGVQIISAFGDVVDESVSTTESGVDEETSAIESTTQNDSSILEHTGDGVTEETEEPDVGQEESTTENQPTESVDTSVEIIKPNKPGQVVIGIVAPLKNKTGTTPGSEETGFETQEDQLLHRLNSSSFRDICGQPVYPSKRIVGGSQASFGEWPWQVSLRQWRSVTYLHKCGAALVNENWAITAAHCVENAQPDQILLRLGEYDLERVDEPYGHLERKVQIIATHPQFDPRTFEYDLALLRFSEPVNFQPNIIPICIPADDYDFIGDTGFVSGWGRLYEDGPLPSVMQKVPVPVITNSECEVMYRNAGYIEDIPNIFICAGYEGGKRDSCEGDSGGPLVIQYKKSWMLAGVISWGIGCALPNQPGVYTRISAFRDWINKIIVF